MASGNLSVGGACTVVSFRRVGPASMAGIVPVISLPVTGEAKGIVGACGISTDVVLSEGVGAELLNDWRPIGVGEVSEGITGAGAAGLAPASSSAGGGTVGRVSARFFS